MRNLFDELLTTAEAAAYLEIPLDTFKKYVFRTKVIQGTKRGNTVFFTRDQLDRFKASYMPRYGRPKKAAGS